MKSLIKTISLLTLTVLGTLLLSCEEKFLDRRPDDQIDAEQAFTRYEKFNQLVTDSFLKSFWSVAWITRSTYTASPYIRTSR